MKLISPSGRIYSYLSRYTIFPFFSQSRHGSCHKEVHTQGPVTGPILESCSQMLKLTRDAREIYRGEEKSDSLCEQVSSSSINLHLQILIQNKYLSLNKLDDNSSIKLKTHSTALQLPLSIYIFTYGLSAELRSLVWYRDSSLE